MEAFVYSFRDFHPGSEIHNMWYNKKLLALSVRIPCICNWNFMVYKWLSGCIANYPETHPVFNTSATVHPKSNLEGQAHFQETLSWKGDSGTKRHQVSQNLRDHEPRLHTVRSCITLITPQEPRQKDHRPLDSTRICIRHRDKAFCKW